jgi:hypothetical protein
VVTLGLGLWGAVGSASPKDNDKGRTTLTVLTKNREAEFLDLKPPGASHADIRVVNAPLYDASGTNRIGRFDVFCDLVGASMPSAAARASTLVCGANNASKRGETR